MFGGTDIPNVNPEVHIQHVAKIFDHNVRTVVALDTFSKMGMLIIPSGKESSEFARY